MTASGCLPQNIVDGILARRFGALYQSISKTNVLKLIRFNTVPTYVFNSILRPNELVDRHWLILGDLMAARKAGAERPAAQPRAAQIHVSKAQQPGCAARRLPRRVSQPLLNRHGQRL